MLIAIIVCLSIALLAAIVTIIVLAHKLKAASDNMRKGQNALGLCSRKEIAYIFDSLPGVQRSFVCLLPGP